MLSHVLQVVREYVESLQGAAVRAQVFVRTWIVSWWPWSEQIIFHIPFLRQGTRHSVSEGRESGSEYGNLWNLWSRYDVVRRKQLSWRISLAMLQEECRYTTYSRRGARHKACHLSYNSCISSPTPIGRSVVFLPPVTAPLDLFPAISRHLSYQVRPRAIVIIFRLGLWAIFSFNSLTLLIMSILQIPP